MSCLQLMLDIFNQKHCENDYYAIKKHFLRLIEAKLIFFFINHSTVVYWPKMAEHYFKIVHKRQLEKNILLEYKII